MGVGGQRHSPAALPPGKIRYALYRRLGGPHSRSGRVWKISPTPGFDPRIVQPVASRYTDWANPANDDRSINFRRTDGAKKPSDEERTACGMTSNKYFLQIKINCMSFIY